MSERLEGGVADRGQPGTHETSLWETLEETRSSNSTFWARPNPQLQWSLALPKVEKEHGSLCTASDEGVTHRGHPGHVASGSDAT